MADKVVVDATNILFTLLRLNHSMERLALGDYTYCAEMCLENICNFAIDRVTYQDETILCFDTGKSWRKSVPGGGYKANREKKKEDPKAKYEADLIYGFMNEFIADLKKFNCFTVIDVNGAEADDGIACLTKVLSGDGHKVTVYSGDVDMALLTQYKGVRVFRKGFVRYPYFYRSEGVTWETPYDQLQYQLFRGQPKDGVLACVNSHDDPGEPFKFGPVAAREVINASNNGTLKDCKKLEKFIERWGDDWEKQLGKNLSRNQILLDFAAIPEYISSKVIEQYCDSPKMGGRNADFEGLFAKYNLFRIADKTFIYENLFGGKHVTT